MTAWSQARHALDRPISVVLSRLLSAGLGLVSALFLARALGPSGRGEASAALAVVGLLPIALGFGIPLVVRRRTVLVDSPAGAIRGARLAALALVPVSVAVALLCRWSFLGDLATGDARIFTLSASLSSLSILWICNANVLLAQGRYGAFAATNLLPIVVYVGLVAIGGLAGWLTVGFALMANLAGSFSTLVLTSILVPVGLRGETDSPPLMLREGFRFSGSQIAEAASYRLDQAIALPVVGATQAGFYAVAATLSLIPFALGQALAAATFKRIATADGFDQARQVEAVLRAAAVLSICTVLGMAAASPAMIPLVFGADFQKALVPSLIAFVGSVGVVLSYVAASAHTALGRGWVMTTAQLVGLVIGIGLLYLLGPSNGAIGLAVASSVGYWVTAVILVSALPVGLRGVIPRPSDGRSSVALLLGRGASR